VDALIDTEPNRLDEAFRRALYEHTDGQALFTAETLRNLQERGDLLKDAEGRWAQSATLDWTALPARVEGVIAERLARLQDDQRETLSVGSVVGTDFAAQVVARVRQRQERDLLRQLSRELGTRHRLVLEAGETRAGRQFLSLFRFAHALFQQYLYNELGHGERRVLHGDVAAALESLYADQTDAVAVQLARHYAEAGDDTKAAEYDVRAGDEAARGYALTEARAHYARALEALARLPDSADTRRRRVDATLKLVGVTIRALDPGHNLDLLRQAEGLLSGLGDTSEDRLRLAHVHCWMALLYVYSYHVRAAEDLVNHVLPAARELNDPDLLARVSYIAGIVMQQRGRYDQSDVQLAQALPPLERTGNWTEWIFTAALHADAVAERGRYAEGVAEANRVVERAATIKSLEGLALSHGIQAKIYLSGGAPAQALEQAQIQLDAATRTGDQLLRYGAFVFTAWAYARLGDLASAEREVMEAQALGDSLGGRLLWTPWLEATRAEIALRSGLIQEAVALAGQTADDAQAEGNLFTLGWALCVQGEAEAYLDPPRWEEAEAHLADSLRAFTEGDARLEVARTHLTLGKVAQARGDLDAAREHYERAAAQFEASGLEQELDAARTLLAAAAGTPAHTGGTRQP
jgi:tetratricopeptide (TPR) repeat protein